MIGAGIAAAFIISGVGGFALLVGLAGVGFVMWLTERQPAAGRVKSGRASRVKGARR